MLDEVGCKLRLMYLSKSEYDVFMSKVIFDRLILSEQDALDFRANVLQYDKLKMDLKEIINKDNKYNTVTENGKTVGEVLTETLNMCLSVFSFNIAIKNLNLTK